MAAVLHRSAISWQDVLDAHATLFEAVVTDASVALVPRWRIDAAGRRHANIVPRTDPMPIQLWLRTPQAVTVREGVYAGHAHLGSDLLMLAERRALDEALAHERPLSELKRRLRRGELLFMVLRTRDELRSRGWTDFLEALGLPFLGTCR